MRGKTIPKFGLVILVTAMAIVLAGCGKQTKQEEAGGGLMNSIKNNQAVEKGEGVVKNLKKALSSGKVMKCESKMGEDTSLIYIKGKDIKTQHKIGDGTMNVLVKDGVMYYWQEGAKKGNKMKQDCMKDLASSLPGGNEQINPKEYDIDEMDVKVEKGEVKCAPVLSGVDFSVPKNVEFVDQCQALKDSMSKLKNLQQNMPSLGQE